MREVWEAISEIHTEAVVSGRIELRRTQQSLAWMDHALEELLRDRFESHPDVADALPDVSRDVVAGKLDPTAAARHLVNLFLGKSDRDREA